MTEFEAIAISYGRFSSKRQEEGDSRRRQLGLAERWCERNRARLDDKLSAFDAGISAFNGANQHEGALAGLLTLIRSGQIKPGTFLLIENFDRLSRQEPLEVLMLLREIIQAGIIVVTLQDDQRYSRDNLDMSRLMLAVVSIARGHDESKTKSVRIKAAWDRRRKEAADGKKHGGRLPAWVRFVNGRFERIPERVLIVQRIFTMVISGIGKHKIANLLNAEGVPGFGKRRAVKDRGQPSGWHTAYIWQIVTGREVLGTYTPTSLNDAGEIVEGEPIENYYPPVVDLETWGRAQHALQSRRKDVTNGKTASGGRKGATYSNLFTDGLAFCRCGATMGFKNRGRDRGTFLICRDAMRGKCAHKRQYRYDDVETGVLVTAFSIDARNVVGGVDDRIALQQQVDSLAGQLTDKRAAFNKWAPLFETAEPGSSIALRVATLNAEIEQLKQRHAETSERLKSISAVPVHKANIGQLMVLVERIAGETDTTELFELRSKLAAELRRVDLRVVFDGDTIRVTTIDDDYTVNIDGRVWSREIAGPITLTA